MLHEPKFQAFVLGGYAVYYTVHVRETIVFILAAMSFLRTPGSITQLQNGVEMTPPPPPQMLHYTHHQQVVTKPEYPAFYHTPCSLAPGGVEHDAQAQPPPGLMLAPLSVSGMSHAPPPSAPSALQNGALSPPQHSNTLHRHKRIKRTQMESMSSVDDDQESLQVR